MESRRKLLREPRCVLCLTCANSTFASRAPPRCVAGADPCRALFECESFVRVFVRAPYVPARFAPASSR
jgi:hypothetical protein